MRFILASVYDISVTLDGGRDRLLPDGRFYSIRGQYVAGLLSGFNRYYLPKDVIPHDDYGKEILIDAVKNESLNRWNFLSEADLFVYIIGFIYLILGDFTVFVRIFNITISIASAYMFFDIARCRLGKAAANLFLLIALFLPTQFFYSLTMSKDILRMFIISSVLWLIYGGVTCGKRQEG